MEKITDKQLLDRIWLYEEKILKLIDDADEIDRSDLQGIVSAIVRSIFNDPVNIQAIIERYTELTQKKTIQSE